jgi:RNA polymerase sigma factor (sigma-70 family)
VEEIKDETIMLRVKEGALADLATLFDRYHVRIYNFFLKLTFDREISQDLTQNLFYRIIKYRQTFEGKENSFKPWIYQMARNIHADHFRQQKKNNERVKRMNNNHDNISESKNSFNEDDFVRLEDALLKLRPEQREILVLSRYQGMKYDEISKIKNLSVPAIKVQVHRTLKELRKIYFNE